MSKSSDEFEHDSFQDADTIVKYLEAIAQGFQTGRLLFCSGKKELVLKPQGLLKFGVQAKRKDGRVKFSLTVGWSERGKEEIAGEPLSIQASGDEAGND